MANYKLSEHPEYKKCMDKIEGYRPGFEFTMDWTQIPRAKGNALRIILLDAVRAGYLDVVALYPGLDGEVERATYRRTILGVMA